jgi:hypothetical protein
MKKYLLAACALLATPASAAPIISIYSYHPALPATVSAAFTLTNSSYVTGNLSFLSNYGSPHPTATITGNGQTINFVTTLLSKPLDTLSLSSTLLSAGSYTLYIKTKDTDLITGGLNATAAPEPAVWSLMILGLGATGFAMRSKRRQIKAA